MIEIDPEIVEYDGRSIKLVIKDMDALMEELKKRRDEILVDLGLERIEEIKKAPCKHEPYNPLSPIRLESKYEMCKHCGVKLVAEWKGII